MGIIIFPKGSQIGLGWRISTSSNVCIVFYITSICVRQTVPVAQLFFAGCLIPSVYCIAWSYLLYMKGSQTHWAIATVSFQNKGEVDSSMFSTLGSLHVLPSSQGTKWPTGWFTMKRKLTRFLVLLALDQWFLTVFKLRLLL